MNAKARQAGDRPASEASRDAVTVGIISDTHGFLPPQVSSAFAGVTHILHAGDVGTRGVLTALGSIAPTTAVRGNMDGGDLGWDLPLEATTEIAGVRFLVAHDIVALFRSFDVRAAGVDVVVTGHTHVPRVYREGGVVYVDPGSAGRGRLGHPKTVAVVQISPEEPGSVGAVKVRIVPLDPEA